MHIFDRPAVRRNRDRAAAIFSNHDFMAAEVAERLTDRLDDITRSFPVALDLGCHCGEIAAALQGRGGIETLVQCDLSPKMAGRAAANGHPALAADEEWLPFAPASFDLVMSCLSLHLVNDLPGTLIQIRRILKPGGLLLAALPGAGTLAELRQAMIEAELDAEGGASPRVAPFGDIKTLGALLPRAGFVEPVADCDTISVRYGDPVRLFADLRGMGEANAQSERRRTLSRRATLLGAIEAYRRAFAGEDGRVPATLELITLTGWAPGP